MKIPSILLMVALLAPFAEAQNLAFDALTDQQVKDVVKEFSADFTQTSVSGASPLGDVFGFEIGVVGGMTKTPEIDKLAKQADPNVDAAELPHASILGRLTVPYGLTVEGNLVPTVGGDDFKFSNYGMALMWSLTSSVVEWPLSFALKAHYMKTSLKFKQTVSSVNANVEFEDTVMGALALVSKKFVVVEPYFGLGTVTGDGHFDVQGTTNFFASGVTSYSAKSSGLHMVAGAELSLAFFKLGAEYSRAFGTSSMTAKVAFAF